MFFTYQNSVNIGHKTRLGLLTFISWISYAFLSFLMEFAGLSVKCMSENYILVYDDNYCTKDKLVFCIFENIYH